MLAGAIQQYLKTLDVPRAGVDSLGDYTADGAAAVSVHVESDGDVEFVGSYEARIQIRTRASNAIDAEQAGRNALSLVLAADGTIVTWTDPQEGGEDRSYLLEAITVVNRPTWYPTRDPGEETSCNVRAYVTEIQTETES